MAYDLDLLYLVSDLDLDFNLDFSVDLDLDFKLKFNLDVDFNLVLNLELDRGDSDVL